MHTQGLYQKQKKESKICLIVIIIKQACNWGGGHAQSATNYIHPAEVALKVAVGDFERNGEVGIGRGGCWASKARTNIWIPLRKNCEQKFKTVYLKTMFGHSTEHAALELTDRIITIIYNKKVHQISALISRKILTPRPQHIIRQTPPLWHSRNTT